MALLKDGTRIYGTLYANTEVVIGSMNVASQINASYNQANTATVLAQAAFDKANTDLTYTQGVNTSQNTRIDAAFNQANVGATFVNSGGTVTGNVAINGNLNVTGNITYTGNVSTVTITGNTGQFFGNTTSGFGALYAGVSTGYTIQPQTVLQASSNYNGYSQINHQNINAGTNSSTDLVATADNGDGNGTFIDMGINSSTYSQPDYNLTGPNDGYLYVSGNTITNGGHLILATMTNKDIIFATLGQKTENEVMRVTSSNTLVIKSTTTSDSKTTGALQVAGGVGIQGDVQATNVYSQGVNLLSYTQDVNTTQNTNITAVNTYATSGYNQANTATTLAQAAFDKANTGVSSSIDQYARDTANTAASNTVYLQTINNNQNTSISFLNVYTQAAFDKANTGGGGGSSTDQYARDTANSKTYTFYQNTAPSTSNAHDLWVNSATGFVYENFGNTTNPIWAEFGPTPVSNTNNVVINTLDRLSNLSSILILNNDGSLKFNDNTLQTTAYTGFGIDNVARITANTANDLAQITSVRSQAAFDKANTAVSSTIGKAIAMAMVFGG